MTNNQVVYWPERIKNEFLNFLFSLLSQNNIDNKYIRNIYIVGSRIFCEYGKSFQDDSDLNVLVFIDEDYFLSVRNRKIHGYFLKIHVNIDINSEKDIYKLGFYNDFSMPYYDLINKKYYKGNENDLYFYLMKKGRLLKKTCFICKSYNVVSTLQIDSNVICKNEININLCENCLKKYTGGLISVINNKN